MMRVRLFIAVLGLAVLSTAACSRDASAAKTEASDTAPPPATVEPDLDANNFAVDHPEQFATVTAGSRMATPELSTTGVVSPDVSRQVPVPSLSSGRVVEIDARQGDTVTKGQLLFKVQSSDIAGAYSDYRKAVKNEQLAVDSERLARIQQDRAKLLLEQGAVAKSALEIANNAEVAAQTAVENAKVD